MVFIHGGSFNSGSGSTDAYGPERFLDYGIVSNKSLGLTYFYLVHFDLNRQKFIVSTNWHQTYKKSCFKKFVKNFFCRTTLSRADVVCFKNKLGRLNITPMLIIGGIHHLEGRQ